jgi:hypothetical protein
MAQIRKNAIRGSADDDPFYVRVLFQYGGENYPKEG